MKHNDDLYNAVTAGEINENSPISVNIFNGPIGSAGFRSGQWNVTIGDIEFSMFASIPHKCDLWIQEQELLDTARTRLSRAVEGETYVCEYNGKTQLKYTSQMTKRGMRDGETEHTIQNRQ